jgi:uncharacterized membrane protein
MIGFSALTLVLFMLQYVFLWVMPSLGVPVLRALHAVNALALFWLTLYLTQNVSRLDQQSYRSVASNLSGTTS